MTTKSKVKRKSHKEENMTFEILLLYNTYILICSIFMTYNSVFIMILQYYQIFPIIL